MTTKTSTIAILLLGLLPAIFVPLLERMFSVCGFMYDDFLRIILEIFFGFFINSIYLVPLVFVFHRLVVGKDIANFSIREMHLLGAVSIFLLLVIFSIYFAHIKYMDNYIKYGYQEFNSWIFSAIIIIPASLILPGALIGATLGTMFFKLHEWHKYYFHIFWTSLIIVLLFSSFLGIFIK